MIERVMEVCNSKDWADVQLKYYANLIKAMQQTEAMGVKLRPYREGRDEYWQVVLVDRRENGSS